MENHQNILSTSDVMLPAQHLLFLVSPHPSDYLQVTSLSTNRFTASLSTQLLLYVLYVHHGQTILDYSEGLIYIQVWTKLNICKKVNFTHHSFITQFHFEENHPHRMKPQSFFCNHLIVSLSCTICKFVHYETF